MILLLDLGNTNLNVGVYQDGQSIAYFRTNSDKLKSEFEYRELFNQFLAYHKLDLSKIEGAILSSVVPSLTRKLFLSVSSLIGKECLIVSNKLHSGLSIQTDNPNELGSDLICGCIGAVEDYKTNCLIVDMGTATKLCPVSKDKVFKGCAIAPGIQTSFMSLWKSAAQLTDIDLKVPSQYIGKNSRDSMNSGVVFGHAQMILGMCDKISEEAGFPMKKIITGGDAYIVKDILGKDFTYNPTLVFDGLYSIYQKNSV